MKQVRKDLAPSEAPRGGVACTSWERRDGFECSSSSGEAAGFVRPELQASPGISGMFGDRGTNVYLNISNMTGLVYIFNWSHMFAFQWVCCSSDPLYFGKEEMFSPGFYFGCFISCVHFP